MGDDHLGWTNPGGFPPHYGLPTVRDATIVQRRGDMVVSTVGGGEDGGGP